MGQSKGVELHHVRMAFSDSMNEVGRFQISKVLHLFALIVRIAWARIRYGTSILYYPPGRPQSSSAIRDAILLNCTRWMFRKTIFHFHAGGSSELIPTLPKWMQVPIKRALFCPDAAIQLSPLTVPDAAYFQAKNVFIVPIGVDDPLVGNGPAIAKTSHCVATHLLYLGTVCETKGILVLLDACHRLRESAVDFQLHVVGSFQPSAFEGTVRARIQELGLGSKRCLARSTYRR